MTDPVELIKQALERVERLREDHFDGPARGRLIAQAVAAERARCAQIARQWDWDHPDTNYGLCIAKKILGED